MQSETKIFVNLDGNSYHRFDYLRIEQSISGHHRFEITYRLDCFSSSTATFFEDTKSLVGKEIVIEMQAADWKSGISTGHFRGLVTEIASSKADHQHMGSVIHVRGYSPTILMEDGANCASYMDQDLKSIARRATTGYPENQLIVKINPRNRTSPHYIVQYNETNFEFLHRLASRFGEWLFYDGTELVFGQNTAETSTLVYGVNLQEFELETKILPQKFSHTTHDYWYGKDLEVSANETYSMAKGITKTMADEASNFFLHNQKRYFTQPTLDSNSNQVLRETAKLKKDGMMGNMVKMNGTSTNPSLKIGHVIEMKGPKLNFGSYIVTKVIHTASIDGNYSNIFEAIPFEMITPPDTNPYIVQHSGDQTAIVTDNSDPEGMGRVRVRFPWSTSLTPWLRMVMPHAGHDKGIYFLPETGEEVVVGFEGGDIEKPYVKGTLYNGNAKASGWKTDGNEIKAIRTRSGHTIELNDKGGNEMITISDKKGNLIQLDTVSGSILVSAPENLSFTAKNIDLSASESISIGARENMSVYAGEDFTLAAKNSTTQIEENANTLAKNIEHNAEKVRVDSTKEAMELASAKTVDLQSGEKVRLF